MNVLAKWHEVAEKQDLAGLDTLVAEDCVFYSPVVHTPQQGKPLTMLYLAAAMDVLGGGEFRYVHLERRGQDRQFQGDGATTQGDQSAARQNERDARAHGSG